ncbi:MAG: hypothetical protein ABI621_05380 [Chloroflexota bacterium]
MKKTAVVRLASIGKDRYQADLPGPVGDAQIEQQFRKHLSVLKPWLVRQPNMEVLYISYNALMADPEPFCRRVMEFVHMPLDLERMLTVPQKDLYRNRATCG